VFHCIKQELEEIIDLSKVEDAESQLLVAIKKVLD
jgi:hypothetical protein